MKIGQFLDQLSNYKVL